MKYLKFETIKGKAIAELRGRFCMGVMGMAVVYEAMVPAVNMRMDPRDLSREWMEEAVKVIERWDVRQIRKLIELFPYCIPKHLHGQKICAEMADNENCDWLVYFGEENND